MKLNVTNISITGYFVGPQVLVSRFDAPRIRKEMHKHFGCVSATTIHEELFGNGRAIQRGILPSLASLEQTFCIFWDAFQQLPMPFWLQVLSSNSKTLGSKTLLNRFAN